jgi:DNA-directed RNA polymerase specialized sigma24 family protein
MGFRASRQGLRTESHAGAQRLPSAPRQQIIRNDVIDTVRSRRTYRETLGRHAERTPLSHVSTPEEEALSAEETRWVQARIRALPRHEALAIIERLENKRSTGATAHRMQIKDLSVPRYLHAGLRRPREALTSSSVESGAGR